MHRGSHWGSNYQPGRGNNSIRHAVTVAAVNKHCGLGPYLRQLYAGGRFRAFVQYLSVDDQKALRGVACVDAAGDGQFGQLALDVGG